MLLLAGVGACEPSTRGHERAKTLSDLDVVSAGIALNQVGNISTYNGAIAELLKSKALSGDLDRYEKDGWGRPYLLAIADRPETGRIFVIISAGPDGIYGTPDDLLQSTFHLADEKAGERKQGHH